MKNTTKKSYQIDQSGKIEQTNKDGVYSILEHLRYVSDVTVDTEYPGKDKLIKQFVVTLLEKNNRPIHHIRFARIGNTPPAHYAAKDVFDKKVSADRILILGDVIEALKKTDGRVRECLATLVDVQTRSIRRQYHKQGKKSRGRGDNHEL